MANKSKKLTRIKIVLSGSAVTINQWLNGSTYSCCQTTGVEKIDIIVVSWVVVFTTKTDSLPERVLSRSTTQ